jgi:hypothetical protein
MHAVIITGGARRLDSATPQAWRTIVTSSAWVVTTYAVKQEQINIRTSMLLAASFWDGPKRGIRGS